MKLWLLGLMGAMFMFACTVAEMPETAEGATIYAENCAFCHGVDGRGEGEFTDTLSNSPPDLTLLAERAGGVLPRAKVMSQIDGYQRFEELDEVMPEFGISFEGPNVPFDSGDGRMTPTPYDLAALIMFLETIQR